MHAKTLSLQISDVHPLETYILDAIAPAGAVKAGVEVVATTGNWPHVDKREAFVDNFRLYIVPETRDSIVLRSAPR